MKKHIAVIIVNFRTPYLVFDCLASLSREIKETLHKITVIIVDNNSGDNSVAILSDAIKIRGWDYWVTILSLPKNGGFAYGNNAAINKFLDSFTVPDYFWLLNPDTVVHKRACSELLYFMEDHPNVGIVGSRLEDPDGTPQISAFRHHSIISEFLAGMHLGFLDKVFGNWVVAPTSISSVPHEAEWVAGASMMVRKEVFEHIGLLDERYFMYFEEEDFCKKANDAGWRSWYVPESRVVHLVGAASGFSDNRKKAPRRPPYWFESRRRFFLKNYGAVTLFLADSAWMLGFGIWRIRRLLQRKPDFAPPFFLKDFFSYSFFCKGFRL